MDNSAKHLFNEVTSNISAPKYTAEAMRKHNEADQEFYAKQARERQQQKAVSLKEAVESAVNSPEARRAKSALDKSYDTKPQEKPAQTRQHSRLYEDLMRKAQQIQNNGHSGNEGLSGPDGP